MTGLVAAASPVAAQDSGGVDANFTFSQGLKYSDEEDTNGTDGVIGRTDLGFNLSSQTRRQTFDLRAFSGFEQDLDGGSLFEITDPQVTLSYGIESRQTALTANLSYRESDANDFIEDSDGTPGVLILDEGTREATGADFGIEFGREARFGGSIDLSYDRTTYSNPTSANRLNSERTSAQFGLRFEIDPRITSTLNYKLSRTNRASGRDVENEGLTFGGQFAVTPILDADVSVGLTRITVEDGGIVNVEEGPSFGIAFRQDRPAGGFRYSLSSDLSESGRRTTARVGGSFQTRRGLLDASFGLTENEDDRIRPTFTVSYGRELPLGSYNVSVNQVFDTNSDGEETLNSRLGITWQQELTQRSRVSSSLTYQATDVLGADDERSRLELGLSYSHDLTEDWAMTTRFTHSVEDSDGTSRRRENEFFVGLETSFGWRP